MNFKDLDLDNRVQIALKESGFITATPIQEKSISALLDGADIIAKAPTGSGKTIGFGLPIVQSVMDDDPKFQALVLVPTRELAKQIVDEIKKLTFKIDNFKILAMIGGEPLRFQQEFLESGVHIVVATPGRVMDFVGKEIIDFSHVKHLVLDEADKMLDMGFSEDINSIISRLKKVRQSMLFSATMNEKVVDMAQKVLNDPEMVEVEGKNSGELQELFYRFEKGEKEKALTQTLAQFNPQSCLIFTNTKQDARDLEAKLISMNLTALALHGDLDQRMRQEVLFMFESNATNILVATDVASRGLDIDDLELVINYDLPHDSELYTHRIGRTARNGKNGTAVSFYRDQYQLDKVFIEERDFRELDLKKSKKTYTQRAGNRTYLLYLGKKDKVRKGDILGALCRDAGFEGSDIGSMKIEPNTSLVSIKNSRVKAATKFFETAKIKGKRCKAKLL